MKPSKNLPVICWWSGGITSAVACNISINMFGVENCRFVLLDTWNEHPDTYRFKKDCEKWYGADIETISNDKYSNIEEVWRRFNGMNFANGAICSSELKREVRIKFQKENEFSYQTFGFDIDEPKRAISMKLNYPETHPIFPLLFHAMSKDDCITYVQDKGIEIPEMYKMGFENNNCWQSGCVQGGIGYWQRMAKVGTDQFDKMAGMEHELTDNKGEPVTMLRNQSKARKGEPLFLKPHPDYPQYQDISQKKGRPPKKLVDCNGYCSINDLTATEEEVEELAQQELF